MKGSKLTLGVEKILVGPFLFRAIFFITCYLACVVVDVIVVAVAVVGVVAVVVIVIVVVVGGLYWIFAESEKGSKNFRRPKDLS